ncbi:MAG TPA: hypothetical protein VIL72_05345, partial [Beijerinckiaceae bacterium]
MTNRLRMTNGASLRAFLGRSIRYRTCGATLWSPREPPRIAAVHDQSAEPVMSQQIPLSPEASAIDPLIDALRDDHTHEIAPRLAYRRLAIVNVAFVGEPGAGDRKWALVDAGLMGSASFIRAAAEARFGARARPA